MKYKNYTEIEYSNKNIILWIILSVLLFFPIFLWVVFGGFVLFEVEYKLFHTAYLYNKAEFIFFFFSFWLSLAIFGKSLKDKLKIFFLLNVIVPFFIYFFIGLYTFVVPHEYTTPYKIIEVEKSMPRVLPKGLEKIRKLSRFDNAICWSYHKESGHFVSIALTDEKDYIHYEVSLYETTQSIPHKVIIIKSENNDFRPYFSPKGDVLAIVSDGGYMHDNPAAQELWLYQWNKKEMKKVLVGSTMGWKMWSYEVESLKPQWLSDNRHIVVGDETFGYTLIDLESFNAQRVTGYNSAFRSEK